MSDRKDRNRDAPETREPEASLDELRREDLDEATRGTEEDAPVGPDSPEPVPDGPNDDRGFDASPPDDVTMARTSDDNDLNPTGGGFTDTPLRVEYETMARHDDLSRRLEDLVADTREWAGEDGSEEAHDIAELLAEAYDRLGATSEDSDDEPEDVAQAEPGNMETPGRS